VKYYGNREQDYRDAKWRRLNKLEKAAPDMLDALQAVCDAYGDRDTLLMAQVKAALAKAKGGVA
jgi:hypothetical protein